ncbi:MAG TPA: biopolymer transporter ExbD [Verrucomicrobiota bacterium]|nr:biopolymer transporter ExbD [Verrucomicrobiota bacterium]HNU50233.1 biopolymer transporter ExbD [Verrucomicrobiota bacterium]
MRFIERKRRQPPAVIIVSLIDILIVLLIFLMVTTTFKQHPAVRLALPETRQPIEGAAEANLVVTVTEAPPYFYLGQMPMTLEKLQSELAARAARDPQAALTIRGDRSATWGRIINVRDAAKSAGIKTVNAQVKSPGAP